MAQESLGESPGGAASEPAPSEADVDAYRMGYTRTMREIAWARSHGWTPTERQLVLALSQITRVYGAVRGGKPIGGQRPDWLRGRADALRELLQRGVGSGLEDH